MSQYVVIDLATGSVFGPNRGDAAIQVMPAGRLAVPMPVHVDLRAGASLEEIKAALCDMVDEQCGAARRRHVTDITGQSGTYLMKLAEAQRWTHGDDPALFPYLGREAVKRDMPLPALIAEVLGVGRAWVGAIDPELESSRVATKKQILAGGTIAEVAQAAVVDWGQLVAEALAQAA